MLKERAAVRRYAEAVNAKYSAADLAAAIVTAGERRSIGEDNAIRHARTCYDHLAGKLAVQMAQAFERKGWLVILDQREYGLTPSGEAFLASWGIDVDALHHGRRILARRCLDWTERRDHIAGSVGAAICAKLFEFRWIVREEKSRVVRITEKGQHGFEELCRGI